MFICKYMYCSMKYIYIYIFLWCYSPTWVSAASLLRFRDYTHRHTTVSRIPLDEWSARRRDLYLTTHNTHNRLTSMPMEGFEPSILETERPETHASDRAATGTGREWYKKKLFVLISCVIFKLPLCYYSVLVISHCFNPHPWRVIGGFLPWPKVTGKLSHF